MSNRYIEGDVSFHNTYIKELPDFMKGVEVRGRFDCSKNKLTSLINSPSSVQKGGREYTYGGGSFNCSRNKIGELVGGPTYVHKNFNCGDNKLDSLLNCPTFVGGDFNCSNNFLNDLSH